MRAIEKKIVNVLEEMVKAKAKEEMTIAKNKRGKEKRLELKEKIEREEKIWREEERKLLKRSRKLEEDKKKLEIDLRKAVGIMGDRDEEAIDKLKAEVERLKGLSEKSGGRIATLLAKNVSLESHNRNMQEKHEKEKLELISGIDRLEKEKQRLDAMNKEKDEKIKVRLQETERKERKTNRYAVKLAAGANSTQQVQTTFNVSITDDMVLSEFMNRRRGGKACSLERQRSTVTRKRVAPSDFDAEKLEESEDDKIESDDNDEESKLSQITRVSKTNSLAIKYPITATKTKKPLAKRQKMAAQKNRGKAETQLEMDTVEELATFYKDKGKAVVDVFLEENNKEKMKGMQKKVKGKHVGKSFTKLRTRNIPKLFVETMKVLSEQQKLWVKDMGFGNLLKLNFVKVPNFMSYWILDNYDEVRCAIKLQDGSYIEVTEEEVERVLGIPRGQEEVMRSGKNGEQVVIVEEWKDFFKQDDESQSFDNSKVADGIRPSHIAEKLSKCTSELWFKRLFINLFISSLIESNQKGTVNYSLIMNNVENVRNWNWCEFVMNSLAHTKLEWSYKKNRFYRGPIILLMLLYVDRVSVIGKENTGTIPVFLGWSDESLIEREKNEMMFGGFGRGRLITRGGEVAKRKEQTSVLGNLQVWMTKFMGKTNILAKAIIDMTEMVDTLPQEFNKETAVKSMIKTAKGLMGKTEEEDKDKKKFEEVWNDLDHPFWSNPQLIECLKSIEKAEELKKLKASASTSTFNGTARDEAYWEVISTIATEAVGNPSEGE